MALASLSYLLVANLYTGTLHSSKNIDYGYNDKSETTSVADEVSGKTENYTYNDTYDRLTNYTRKLGETTEYTEAYAYDKDGKVSSVTQSGAAARTYSYAYKDNAARELESITMGTYKFLPQTDKQGRNAGREIWKDSAKFAAEYIFYRKVGDPCNKPREYRVLWQKWGNGRKGDLYL